MVIEKTVLTVLGVALAGFVGYKIIKKKNPEWIKQVKKVISNPIEGTEKLFKGAKSSFLEGYASA